MTFDSWGSHWQHELSLSSNSVFAHFSIIYVWEIIWILRLNTIRDFKLTAYKRHYVSVEYGIWYKLLILMSSTMALFFTTFLTNKKKKAGANIETVPVAPQLWHWLRENTTWQSEADRIWHEKVTRALRRAGGVQFLNLLPEAAGVICSEAAVTFGQWAPEKKPLLQIMSKQWLRENTTILLAQW